MFDTAYYLHYVLDVKEDNHYTEDLMQLSPEAYLWHELKERHGFEYVVFVDALHNKLMLKVFDRASKQWLCPPKKSFFSKIEQIYPFPLPLGPVTAILSISTPFRYLYFNT